MDNADKASICAFLAIKVSEVVDKYAHIESYDYQPSVDLFTVTIARLTTDMHVERVERELRSNYDFTHVWVTVNKGTSPKIIIEIKGGWPLYKRRMAQQLERDKFYERFQVIFVLGALFALAMILDYFFYGK